MKSQIDALRQLTHELLYLGMDGEPIYADRFHQLNSEVYSQAVTLAMGENPMSPLSPLSPLSPFSPWAPVAPVSPLPLNNPEDNQLW